MTQKKNYFLVKTCWTKKTCFNYFFLIQKVHFTKNLFQTIIKKILQNKLWQYSKNQIVTTQIMTTPKLKIMTKLKIKKWQPKNQIVTKPKIARKLKNQVMTKLKKSNCDNTTKTQTLTKRINSNYDKTSKLK